jgi:hypothetical protein
MERMGLTGCFVATILSISVLIGAPAFANTYWIDAENGVNNKGCGAVQNSACRSYDYWYSMGCDGNGCGNGIGPGDTIFFRAGIYAGDGDGRDGSQFIAFPFDGDKTAPVTVACFDEPHSCIVDGGSIVRQHGCPLLGVGLKPDTSYCGSNAASYMVIEGFLVRNPRPGMSVAEIVAGDHIVLKNNVFDGLGGTEQLFDASSGVDFLTFTHNEFLNCPGSGTGCLYLPENANVALVGNRMGPIPTSGNFDCETLVGTRVGLVDGNVCQDAQDGIDQGRNNPGLGAKLEQVIIRYNQITGIGGSEASRALPLSGNVENHSTATQQNITGKNVVYKNVMHPNAKGVLQRCIELYGGASNIEVAYNTCMGSSDGGYGHVLWIDPRGDFGSHWSEGHKIRFNIFDTLSTNAAEPIVLDEDATTINGCPSDSPCPFTSNGIWMGNRGANAACVYWDPSDRPIAHFTCAEFAEGFNNENWEHDGNFRANPFFVGRSQPSELSNLALTAKSMAYIDRGESFCVASRTAYGNTIEVSCDGGGTEPSYYFPQPKSFYGLENEDCRDQGIRAADATNPGCFEIQIEGDCAVRQVASMNANSITISGQPCSWDAGAKVHVPWNGVAPDIGALEFGQPIPTTVGHSPLTRPKSLKIKIEPN